MYFLEFQKIYEYGKFYNNFSVVMLKLATILAIKLTYPNENNYWT